jgi:hypothetical protein
LPRDIRGGRTTKRVQKADDWQVSKFVDPVEVNEQNQNAQQD